MKRRMKRLFCLFLSSAMMLTGNAYGALQFPRVIEVKAAETGDTKVYSIADLENSLQNVASYTEDDGCVKIHYEGGTYQEVRYAIPEALRGRVESITCNVIEAGQHGNLAVKVFDKIGGYEIGSEKAVNYGSNSIAKGIGNTVWEQDVDAQSFGLMWTGDVATDITLESVTFVLSEAGIPAGDYTYSMADLAVKSTYKAEVVPSGNGVDITIQGQYDEARFEIPAEIANRVEAITVNGDGNYGKMSVKMLTADNKAEGGDEFQVAYGNNSVSKENPDLTPILYVGIMSLSEDPVTFHVDSITFTLNDGKETEPVVKKVDTSLTPVREALKENGLLAGTCIPASALQDEERMKLVTHHFNSVTCENEMKPDSFLSNATFEGNDLVALDFTQGDAVADALLAYNEAHPDQEPIRMRGHVLVWHSQTPDKFFYENGDKNGRLLSKEEMLVRLEQYIKLVMEHYYGEDSKYKDLIYAWDVVNEQANDDGSNPGIRMGTKWAEVFGGSDEYIRMAFVYANKYAPENVKLFYNDYNDTSPAKSGYICKLLQAVKDTEGARIDGMGMQAHYNISGPSYEEFETAIKNYSKIVGEVQLTELDMKGSDDYDGKFHDVEYAKQAYRYKGYYDSILKLNKEGSANVTAITFWGTDDGNSWLNDFNGAGGGADGKHKVCPLLFDKTYAAKPTYWVFVDQSKLPAEPPVLKSTKAVNATQTDDALEEKFGANDTKVSFRTAWDGNALKVKVNVEDANSDENDKIKVYYDLAGTRGKGDNVKVIEIPRNEATATEQGYEATVTINAEEGKNLPGTLLFDVKVENGENAVSWSDTTNSQDTSNAYFGSVSLATKVLAVKKGSPDSIDSDVWDSADAVSLNVVGSAPEATAAAKILWDEENLYIKVDVVDADLDATAANAHEHDSVEVFIDEGNEKNDSYDDNDKQYRVDYENAQSFNGSTCKAENITSETKQTENGYTIYSKIKWTSMAASAGKMIGLDIQINDGKDGKRIGTRNLFDASGNGWSNPSVFGSAKLIEGEASGDQEEYPSGQVTFKADELKTSFVTNDADYTVSGSEAVIAYKKQYEEVRFEVPEAIQDRIESVTFNVREDVAGSLSVKVFDAVGGYDVKEKAVVYGNNSYQAGSEEFSIKSVGLMSLAEGAQNVTLESITFVLKGAQKPSIEQDIPDWKDSVSSVLGENAIAGGAIMLSEITDDTLMDLVEKHFNAVTFGNELKPDALFNYQLENSVKTKTIKFDGQDLEVPVVNDAGDSLDFSRADAMAEKILEWNEAHPDKKIRIRGHVLVWHSQTQEWFFHENYDISKPYVDKETMNRRLEWYISSVFDHYFGEDANGKYDGLFYGWDVVNEAVVGNGYRTDKVSASEDLSEVRHGNNSSWWHVYESNEFIINAFKYANKYAPKDVELYYNDYGETDNIKCEGILKLINDVKAAEGTRLDAFGMQAHYSVDGFSAAQFKTVAEKYAKAAGKVQLTELDFKASSSFDGSAAARESEYTKMAYCHKQLFDAIKDLNKEETKVTGLTVWGVIEPNSWLHSQSNVGGGANGSKQCPLLFDGNYKAKPAYWAYVDATKLQPYIQKITVEEAKNGKIAGQSYRIEQDDTIAEIVPVWDKDGLTVQVNVTDATVDATDAVTVYVDAANSASEGITPQKTTVNRSDAEKTETGYKATVKVPVTDLAVAKTVGMDVVVMNGEQKASFNDLTGAQETSSKYYAKATMKPCVEEVPFGTVTIDGEKDAAWDKAVSIPLTINLGSKVSANAKVLWDKNNLYVYAEVADSDLNKDNGNAWEQDSLEVFIDENNGKTASYDGDDKQYRINYDNEPSFAGTECKEENLKSFAKKTADGYVIEAAFKWTDLVPENGKEVGLEFQVNDADASGKRIGTLSWNDETGMGWSGSNVFGTVRLVGEEKKPETNPDSGSGSSSTGNTTTTKPQTKPETTVETNADGSTTETSKVTIAITGGKDVEASVAVSKDADGKVTEAKATVSATKGQLSAEVVKQLKEAAGTASIAVTTEVKDTKGNVKYTVSADSKDLKAGATLKVVAIDKKTGAYELVNAKSYKVDKNGNITVSLPKGADYQLLSTKEADKVEKAIVKTIAVKKSTGTVKKGKTTKIQLSSKLNMDNVKKVTYLSSKKSVATVNKSGKITAKKKGTVTVKATVTLKNGKKKTVSMKVTVK